MASTRVWRLKANELRWLAVIVIAGLFAVGCTTTATIDGTTEQPTSENPIAPNQSSASPTPAPVEPPAIVPTPPATSVPPVPPVPLDGESTEAPQIPGPPPRMDPSSPLGISNDGRFAYVGTSSTWTDAPPCDGPTTESIIGIDVITSDDTDTLMFFEAGLEQPQTVRQIMFGDQGQTAVLSWCDDGEPVYFLQLATVDDQGRFSTQSDLVRYEQPEGEFAPSLIGMFDQNEVQLYVPVDSREEDPFLSYRFDQRTISLTTGETLSSESFLQLQEAAAVGRTFDSPDGRYTYRPIDDPDMNPGCEGAGAARTLEVESESGTRLALGTDGVLMASINDLHFGPNGLVAWTNGCVDFQNVVVGRVGDDGIILDGHYLDGHVPIGLDQPDGRYRHFRLSSDGHLIGLGPGTDGSGGSQVRVFRYDLATDVQFVETAVPPLLIDRTNSLGTPLSGTGGWYVGEATSGATGCDAKTLYAETTTGLARVIAPDIDIDTIVEIEVSETRTVTGFDEPYDTRVVVVETECASEYEGRRVWFSRREHERVRDRDLELWPADLGAVRDVLAVYEIVAPGDTQAQSIIVEVEQLDGTIEEIELIPAT